METKQENPLKRGGETLTESGFVGDKAGKSREPAAVENPQASATPLLAVWLQTPSSSSVQQQKQQPDMQGAGLEAGAMFGDCKLCISIQQF